MTEIFSHNLYYLLSQIWPEVDLSIILVSIRTGVPAGSREIFEILGTTVYQVPTTGSDVKKATCNMLQNNGAKCSRTFGKLDFF